MLSNIRKTLFRLDDTNVINVSYKNKIMLNSDIMFPSMQNKINHFNLLNKHNGFRKFHNRQWSLDLFKSNDKPLMVGQVNGNEFSKRSDKFLWTMDLPIKMPFSDIRVPDEFEQFREFIEKAYTHEVICNPNVHNWYAYLCIDQRQVLPMSTQRRPGAHADSFPTGNVHMNRLSDSVYLAYDCLPTEFCNGNFTFELSINTNINKEIISHFENKTNDVHTYPDYHIIKMDSGHVHQVGFNKTANPIDRTFIKLTFSPDIFNRIGNDHNYLFDYNWPLYERSVERNNSSVLDGYVNDMDFEYVSFEQINNMFDYKAIQIHRVGPISIKPAIEGELLSTVSYTGNFMTCNVAKLNDWKVTNLTSGAEYFLSTEKLNEFYNINVNEICNPTFTYSQSRKNACDELIYPKNMSSLAVKLYKNIKIDAPWGTKQYLRKGDVMIKRFNGDIYGITEKDFEKNYCVI